MGELAKYLNKITVGDCLVVLKDLPDESIDMILTDPPYGIDYSRRVKQEEHIANDEFDAWKDLMIKVLPEFRRVMKPTACCLCFCGGAGGLVTALLTLEAIKYFHLIETLIWVKGIGLGYKYRHAYENILLLTKDRKEFNFYDTTGACSNVIRVSRDKVEDGDHPTPKPVKLLEGLMKNHTKEGDVVLDPFLGGGSTAVAAVRLKRQFIGVELNPKYAELAAKRVDKALKKVEGFSFRGDCPSTTNG